MCLQPPHAPETPNLSSWLLDSCFSWSPSLSYTSDQGFSVPSGSASTSCFPEELLFSLSQAAPSSAWTNIILFEKNSYCFLCLILVPRFSLLVPPDVSLQYPSCITYQHEDSWAHFLFNAILSPISPLSADGTTSHTHLSSFWSSPVFSKYLISHKAFWCFSFGIFLLVDPFFTCYPYVVLHYLLPDLRKLKIGPYNHNPQFSLLIITALIFPCKNLNHVTQFHMCGTPSTLESRHWGGFRGQNVIRDCLWDQHLQKGMGGGEKVQGEAHFQPWLTPRELWTCSEPWKSPPIDCDGWTSDSSTGQSLARSLPAAGAILDG